LLIPSRLNTRPVIPRALDQFRFQAKIPAFSTIYWDLIGSDQPPLVSYLARYNTPNS
jgi:hypothetical protein